MNLSGLIILICIQVSIMFFSFSAQEEREVLDAKIERLATVLDRRHEVIYESTGDFEKDERTVLKAPHEFYNSEDVTCVNTGPEIICGPLVGLEDRVSK